MEAAKLMFVVVVLLGYALGSIPMGYIFVKLIKGKDITQIGSGRTGGTNAMRAGGLWTGVLTAFFDGAKGFFAVWLATLLLPHSIWAHVLAGNAAVIGHNWSIWLYLASRRFSAGAGTGPNVGAAIFLWPWTVAFILPVVLFFIFVVGYASLASALAALVIPVIFLVRYLWFGGPWQYIIFGIISSIAILWALRGNFGRLLNGTERMVGLRARNKKNIVGFNDLTRKPNHSSSSSSSSS
jgi:glycerol-3-phosphate acyltransferase PlsY